MLIGLLVALSFGMAAWAYPQLPAMIASHWNIMGQVDGYMSKFWGLFLLPFILAGLWLLLTAIPRIDPMKANLATFRPYYNLMVLLIIVILAIIDKLLLLWNLGTHLPISNIIDALLGIMAIGLGVLLPYTKRNFFMGIRTPWTLASDQVWNETHRRAGKVFLVAGVVALVSSLLPVVAATSTAIGTLLLAVAWTVVDSYYIYRRLSRSK